MAGSFSLSFASAPALLPAYVKIALARKARVPITSLPRIEATLTGFRVDPRHLARYRAVCCERESHRLPLTYPHVMATPVHLAMIASDSFPVSLLGVVHVRNRIEQRRPLGVGETGDIHCSIEGYRETPQGQELDLQTQIRTAGQEVWSETSTLLARTTPTRSARRQSRSAALGVGTPDDSSVRTLDFTVDLGTGRRYALVSGDFNPIHMTDVTARLFGFKRAIAHGMWSLARCIAELPSPAPTGPCTLDVAFKLPIALPARVTLESWSVDDGLGFALRDRQCGRGHLFGTLLTR